MVFKKIYTVAILTLFMAFGAQAQSKGGLFVEPGLSYEVSDSSVSWPSPFSSSSGSANGFGLLGKAGIHINESVFVAIDGRYQQLKFKDSTNHYNADANAFNIGPVIGVQMPNLGLRVWGGYVLAGEMDPQASNGLDARFSEAHGFRVGTGFRIAALSLNLEYQDLDYGRSELEQLGPFSTNVQSESIRLENKSYVLSLTFPLEM